MATPVLSSESASDTASDGTAESAVAAGTPASAEATPKRRRVRRADLAAIGAYVMLGVFVCLEHWLDVSNRISSHLPSDHSWFEWLFSHGAYSVRHLENPLFSAQQNAPDGVNMMANTSILGVTLPLAPVTWLLGPQVTYVLYLGGALAATAATSYWMLSRYLVSSRAAAFAGGAFLGFAPGVIHHANGQPNFVSHFLLPIIVVRVLRLGEPGRWLRNGIVLGLLVAYQIFINEEMLLLTALACLVVVVGYAIARREQARAKWRSFVSALGVGGGLALLLTAYPIWYQFNGPQSSRGLQDGVFHSWGEDLAAYVTFSRDTIAGNAAVEQTIGLTEQNSWFGWPLVALAVLTLALLWRRSGAARIAGVVIAVFTIASLGPRIRFNGTETELYGPWHFISDELPLVEMMMPTRLALVVTAAVGVLIALAWESVARADLGSAPSAAVARKFGYAAVALALLPLFPTPLPTRHVESPPAFITSGAWREYVDADRTLVPVPVPSNVHGLATLRWSALTQHEFAVPGGYFIGPNAAGDGIFGAPPRPTTMLMYQTMSAAEVPQIDAEQRRQALEDLRFWNAAVVVLGAHEQDELLLELMTELLGPAVRVDDVWLWDVRQQVG
ncbi:hypothetical protein ACK8GG_11025 [Micromonosporaceae bacterium DT55]|uniref:hypothetical protein n=1 Tax=Melissospora conviva TaxID=3388432 RepID=UPI003C273297